MPRTRSLAWSELKIGIVVDLRARHRRRADLHAERLGRLLLAALLDQDRLPRHRGPEGRRAGACRRRGSGLGHGDRLHRRPGRGDDGGEQGAAAADHRLDRSPRWGRCRCSARPPWTSPLDGQGTPIPEWGYVPTRRRRRVAGERRGGGDQRASRRPTALLKDVRQGRGTLGKLVTDDSCIASCNDFVDVGRGGDAEHQPGTRHARTADERSAAAQSLEGSLENLEMVTARIRNGEGSLGQLLNDDALSKSRDIGDQQSRRDHRPHQQG